MDEIKKMLDEEIRFEIDNLGDIDIGSEKQTVAVDNLAKLYKLRIDENRNLSDADEKQKQLKEDARIQRIRLGIEIASIIVSVAFSSHWMRKGYEFETNQTYTSTTFRDCRKGVFDRFRLKK